ncbi:nuclear pore complex protein Nup153 isoform X2 [Agrilus planipennis]|uniref:Nuclear pore complex protein Nup153 n=1 Tax=Agrilus planipennis TaxID=224129 RepID=A0A1W4W8Q3_AGRPL|nr:nuclear pore complex protein Nup153 isoform X2 [Agrilus planipennis]
MAKQNDINFYVSSSSMEHDSEKSFVKKVKSRVSDLIPASISKWFGSEDNSGRSREDDGDIYQVEPPLKRARIPSREKIENSLSNNFSTTTPHIHYAPVSGLDVISDNCVSVNNKKASKRMLNSLSEPEAGPSGIKSRKLLISSGVTVQTDQRKLTETNINGDKNSDSDESTSDYSSMARNGSREATISKKPHIEEFKSHDSNPSREIRERLISQTRSLFSERGVSPHSNSSLSSRRPSFNASTFGSPDFVDRTLTTKRIIHSPFYGGRTTYGGASAYSHRLKKNADIKNSLRNAFEVKPANESVKTENATLSKTARRILDTLEQYTTPVSEAKKIPNPSLRRGTTKRDGLLSKYTGANPYFVREPKNTPSSKELQVPTVPDLLKMKLKEKLQDSTVAVRQIAATSKAAQNADEYKLRDKDDEQATSKHVNKMRNKVSNIRKRTTDTMEQEKVEQVKLPDIALPITTLPKFDFGILPTTSASGMVTKAVTTTSTRVVTKETETETDEGTKREKQVTKISITNESKKITSEEPKLFEVNDAPFKFAKPVVLLSNNLKSIIGSNDFVFSKPLNQKEEVQNNFKSSSSKYELKRKSQSGINFLQTAKMDLMSAFKPSANTWECNVCLIRNVQDRDKCAACQAERASKPLPTATASIKNHDFGNKFKLTSDVRNKNMDTNCVASTTPKPIIENSFLHTTNEGFGDKFKPPSDTWVCGVCMIRNKNDLDKCAACESPNPNAPKKSTSFADAFKMKKDEWECPICMVRNPETKGKCACCETPRPKLQSTDKSVSENKNTMSTFNFGINDAVGVVTSKGFTFGIPKDLRETEKTSKQDFSFGVPNEKNVSASDETKPVLFNGATNNNKKDTETSESNNNSKPTFCFGITTTSSVATPSSKSVVSTANSTETTVTSSTTITTTSSFGFTTKTLESSAPSSFVFGASTVKDFDSKAPTETNVIPTPIFKHVPEKKSDSSATITSTMFANKADSSTTKTNTVPAPVPGLRSPATTNKPSSIFGTSAKPDSSTSIFGSPAPPKVEVPAPIFGSSTFGKPTPVAFGTAKPDSSTSSIFGSNNSTGDTDNKQKTDAVFKFGTTPTQAISFGGASSSFQTTPFITSSIPAPTFRMPVTSTTDQGAFCFGQDTSTKPFNYGQQPQQTTEVTKPAAGYSFEQQGNKQQQEQKFNFGSNSTSSAGFSFGASSNPTVGGPGFNFKPMFDSSQQQQQQQQTTSIFGNSSATAASSVVSQQPPQLLQNGGFNFGNVPPKGGFNFAPQSGPSAAPGVFSFGGTGTNAVPEAPGNSGGFSFGSTQFNANVKPNFNFTGAVPPTFSATTDPSSSVPAGRKKIKAVRRNQQR